MTENNDGRRDKTTDYIDTVYPQLEVLDSDEVLSSAEAGFYHLPAESTVVAVLDIEGEEDPSEMLLTTQELLAVRLVKAPDEIERGTMPLSDLVLLELTTEEAAKDRAYIRTDVGTINRLSGGQLEENEDITEIPTSGIVFKGGENQSRISELTNKVVAHRLSAAVSEQRERESFRDTHMEQIMLGGVSPSRIQGVRFIARIGTPPQGTGTK